MHRPHHTVVWWTRTAAMITDTYQDIYPTHTHIPNGSSAPRIYFFDLFGQVVVVVSRFRGRQSTALPECLSWEFQSGRLWTSLKPSLPISSTKKDLQKSTRTNPRYWIDMIGFRRMHKGTGFFHMLSHGVGAARWSNGLPRLAEELATDELDEHFGLGQQPQIAPAWQDVAERAGQDVAAKTSTPTGRKKNKPVDLLICWWSVDIYPLVN